MNEQKSFNNGSICLFCGDALELYDTWETPTVIISDGPYGVNGFPGDFVSPDGLDKEHTEFPEVPNLFLRY